MSRRPRDLFQTIRTEGGLLPPELLKRIAAADHELPGIVSSDYHLEDGARLSEAVTRSWNRIRVAWEVFRDARATLAEGAPDAALTRDRWLLVLFQELAYGRLLPARGGIEIDGKPYPISHLWNQAPIHLVGFRTELDRRTAGVAGAAKQSPHSLVQEFLNRSPNQLWGFVSNGLLLRLLRDNASLTRQAFVEFDLEAMLDGEIYADFALLWLVCHQSRIEAERPAECWLERWVEKARDQGTRALDRLRSGVETSIAALGRGFLAHPRNAELREALRSGALDKQDYYRELLRLVYRLLFLLVAEDRGLLLDPSAKPEAKARYREHYSTERLRRLAARRRGGPHPDGWRALRLVMAKLGDDAGCPDLALPGLGSFLWSRAAVPHLADAELANEQLFEAVRALAFTESDRLLRPVDWRNLDSEELGSVYESLLELHPLVDAGAAHFELSSAAGHERKTTGSYYTPDALVTCLLDTALDPVLDSACRKSNPEQALLNLKICDPACGSGHFLIAAARRLARRLAQMRTGDAAPDPTATQAALRDVVCRCLYGVDLNPMAVELCKVSLWLEAIEPGKPLSFLDHHIRLGNSLLGATPELIAAGLPDDAFSACEDDDKRACAVLKSRSKGERTGLGPLFARKDAETQALLERAATALEELPEERPDETRAKELAFRRHEETEEYRLKKQLADAWCAAFLIRKHFLEPGRESSARGITQGHLNNLANARALPTDLAAEADRLAGEFRFLHWHLAFPEVFARGGFDCVLGNPPWVSYTGRQQAEVSDRFLHLLLALFPSIARWPASHPAFAVLSSHLLAADGRAGLVLPKQVADLAAYGGVRKAVTEIARLASPVVDAGEAAFPGVTQPVGLFSIVVERTCPPASQEPWPIASGDFGRRVTSAGNAVTSSHVLAGLTTMLAGRPRFAPKTFADPGVHTGNVSKKIILETPPEGDAVGYERVREGRDIAAFVCGAPRKWLWVTPLLVEEEYCTIRPEERYRSVPILVRQTANRPIAARHCSPTYFRNSLLACMGVPGVPDTVVIAFLNSALYAWLHRTAVLDANQKAFPQVKVRHLQSLPAIPADSMDRVFDGRLIRNAIEAAVLEAEAAARTAAGPSAAMLETIERMVLAAFDLDTGFAPTLLEAVRS